MIGEDRRPGILVTGGGGDIGRAIALRLAQVSDAVEIVDRDEALGISVNAGCVEGEITSVGRSSHGEKDVRAVDFGRVGFAADVDAAAIGEWREGDAFGVEAKMDALLLEEFAHCF